MRIDIWSDVVCPFCYIGKRQFEIALDQFEHKNTVEIVWHSFELDPNTPKPTQGTLTDMLVAKYNITPERASLLNKGVVEMAALVGLYYDLDAAKPSNSFDAHRIIQLAKKNGLADKAEERFFSAYFIEGKDIANTDTLKALAVEIGLDSSEVAMVLAGDEFAEDVRADQHLARQMNINAVPFFVIDNKYGLSGAQGGQTFLKALHAVWEEENKQKN